MWSEGEGEEEGEEGEGEEEDLAFIGGASPGGLAPQKVQLRVTSSAASPDLSYHIPVTTLSVQELYIEQA